MKGKLKLVPVTNPYEGKKVIWNNKVYQLNGQRDENEMGYQSNYWLVGDEHTNISDEPLHVFKELVMEYDDIQPSSRYPIIHKTLPLYPQQYDWALAFLHTEVDFDEYTPLDSHESSTDETTYARIHTATPVRTIEDIPEKLRPLYDKITVSSNSRVNQFFRERFTIPHNHDITKALEEYDEFLNTRKDTIVMEFGLPNLGIVRFEKLTDTQLQALQLLYERYINSGERRSAQISPVAITGKPCPTCGQKVSHFNRKF